MTNDSIDSGTSGRIIDGPSLHAFIIGLGFIGSDPFVGGTWTLSGGVRANTVQTVWFVKDPHVGRWPHVCICEAPPAA
jgi:hypothetical protein